MMILIEVTSDYNHDDMWMIIILMDVMMITLWIVLALADYQHDDCHDERNLDDSYNDHTDDYL